MGQDRTLSRRINLTNEILAILADGNYSAGDRLFEARIAQRLGVSRAPVRANLIELCKMGIVSTVANKGFILESSLEDEKVLSFLGRGSVFERTYMQIADDHLDGLLPEICTEQELQRRYELSDLQLRRVLERAASSGWAEKASGYGWRFSEVLRRPEAYSELMQLRAIIEPGSMLLETFSLASKTLADLKMRQLEILEKGPSNFANPYLFKWGCEFHEVLVAASGNEYALSTLRRLNAHRRLFAYRVRDDDRLTAHFEEHLEIILLLEGGDIVGAAEKLRTHLIPSGGKYR